MFKQVKAIFGRFCHGWENLRRRDLTGRTILHHAAEAGCSKILSEVMHRLKNGEGLTDEEFLELSRADENGRTPIMHVLRLRHGYEDDGDLEKQFSMLYKKTRDLERTFSTQPEKIGSSGWMQQRKVLHPKEVPKELHGITVKATTELMHAARGGYESLQLALDKVRESTGESIVKIDTALNVTFEPELATGTEPAGLAKEAWGWGMLLAAAARGGHVDVLKAVVYAIEARLLSYRSSFVRLRDRSLECLHRKRSNSVNNRQSVFPQTIHRQENLQPRMTQDRQNPIVPRH